MIVLPANGAPALNFTHPANWSDAYYFLAFDFTGNICDNCTQSRFQQTTR